MWRRPEAPKSCCWKCNKWKAVAQGYRSLEQEALSEVILPLEDSLLQYPQE